MRIACLLIPDLPLYAERRANPELAAVPLVITTAPGTRAEILCACPRARALGVRPGLSLIGARALTQDLVVRVASPALEESARQTLFDVAISLAPRAELAPRASGLFATEAAVFVDAEGTEALHGNERSFASVLHARAERAGFSGVVALTSSRSIARLAARHAAYHLVHASRDARAPSEAPLRVLLPGEELAFLSPLPIDLLDPSDRTAEALTRFGIHHIRDLLRLPRRDLAARLGPGLLELVARARGEEVEPPLPEPADARSKRASTSKHRSRISRRWPSSCAASSRALVERLDLRALGCARARLDSNSKTAGRRVAGSASPRPPRTSGSCCDFCAWPSRPTRPAAPLEASVLRCEGIPLRREQLDLFLPRGPSPSELDQTLAELGSICGADRVGSPEVADDHRPDAFVLKPFRTRKPRRAARPTRPSRARANGLRPRPPGSTRCGPFAPRSRRGPNRARSARPSAQRRQPRGNPHRRRAPGEPPDTGGPNRPISPSIITIFR